MSDKIGSQLDLEKVTKRLDRRIGRAEFRTFLNSVGIVAIGLTLLIRMLT